jgi:hypothetical protein
MWICIAQLVLQWLKHRNFCPMCKATVQRVPPGERSSLITIPQQVVPSTSNEPATIDTETVWSRIISVSMKGYNTWLSKTQLWLKCKTEIKPLLLYFNVCLSIMLDSLSCSFTSMSFLTNALYLAVSDYIMCEICLFQLKYMLINM